MGYAGNTGAILDYTKVQNKIIKIKLNVTAIVGSLDIYNGHPNLIKTINNVGKYEIVFFAVNNAQYPNNSLHLLALTIPQLSSNDIKVLHRSC